MYLLVSGNSLVGGASLGGSPCEIRWSPKSALNSTPGWQVKGDGWGSLGIVLWLVGFGWLGGWVGLLLLLLLLQDKKSIDGFLIDTGSRCIFTCI